MFELILILIAILLFCTYCPKGKPGLKDLQGFAYAHRGLHGNGIPENSMAAFKAALDHGYGIELDVHLLKDGNLAVIHDSLLNRTTGQSGHVEELTTDELKNYPLEGTEETIPTFREVLDLYDGQAPIIVEMKPENGNQAALAEAVCKMLETYNGVYCLESFDPRCVMWLKKNRPNLVRGQLTENFFKSRSDLPDYLKFALAHNLLNVMGRPDFIAYRFADRKDSFTTALCRKLWKCQGVTWTITSQEDYDTAVAEGWLPIFEGFEP